MEHKTPYPTQSQSFALIKDDGDTVIYEGGWWMTKSDWRKIWIEDRHWFPNYGDLRTSPNPRWGLDHDERTHQITLFLMPFNDEER